MTEARETMKEALGICEPGIGAVTEEEWGADWMECEGGTLGSAQWTAEGRRFGPAGPCAFWGDDEPRADPPTKQQPRPP